MVVTSGAVAEGTGEPSLSRSGRPGDDQVDALGDPPAFGQLQDEGPIEAARGPEVDVLDRRLNAELGMTQAGLEALGVTLGAFSIDEEREAILEAEVGHGGIGDLLVEGAGHAVEAEGFEAGGGGMSQHRMRSFQW